MRSFSLLPLLLLTACSAEPRSASYFAENPQEAAKVVADCKSGEHRGQECQHAELAVSNAERDRVIQKYREGLSR